MKYRKHTVLLTIIGLCLNISAQYQQGMIRLNYSDSSGEEGITTYIYNGRVHPYKAIWELEDGSRSSVNFHTFDPDGNLTEKHREFSDSLVSDQFFTYDSCAQLVHETFKRSDGIQGEVDYIYGGGRCLKAVCKGLNGWFFGEIHYRYDQLGLKDSALLLIENQKAGKIKYAYDEKKRLMEEVWHFPTGFMQVLKYEYLDSDCIQYRSSNVFLIQGCTHFPVREEYDYNGEGGGPSYYSYEKNNKLVKKTFVRSDGLRTVTEYFYHDNGLLSESIRQYNDGKTGTFTYKYNHWGQLVQRDFRRSDGVSGSELYKYDKNGKLISGRYVNFDGWLTGDLIFHHDPYDRVSGALFKNGTGADADIFLEYDEKGSPVKVFWLFHDGRTQTYKFFYQDAPSPQ